MKLCHKCKRDKDISEYYCRKTGPRAGECYEKCKECMKLRGRTYYHKNHERQLALKLKNNRKNYYLRKKIMIDLKNKPCVDCGKNYPYYVMDFDHRDRSTKIDSPSRLRSYSFKSFLKEVEKCDIVCANCHRIRTFKNLIS